MYKLTIPIPPFTPLQHENFWAKVRPTGFCWEWTAGKTGDGYGKFNVWPKMVLAHRASYTLLVGVIEDGLELDHLCRNKACVNPDHLDPVTSLENLRRVPKTVIVGGRLIPPWVTSGKDVTGICSRGHAYTEENTYHYKDGRTDCRQCRRINRVSRSQRLNLTLAPTA